MKQKQKQKQKAKCIKNTDAKKWYLNGLLHRYKKPAIEYFDGTKIWYIKGECHREDGPAVEHFDGTKIWYIKGKLHREDGPAVEYPNDGGIWYYLNNKQYTKNDYWCELYKHGKISKQELFLKLL